MNNNNTYIEVKPRATEEESEGMRKIWKCFRAGTVSK